MLRKLVVSALLLVALVSIAPPNEVNSQMATTVTLLGIVTTQSTYSYLDYYTVSTTYQLTTQTGTTVKLTVMSRSGSSCPYATFPFHAESDGEYFFEINSASYLDWYIITPDQAKQWLSLNPVPCVINNAYKAYPNGVGPQLGGGRSIQDVGLLKGDYVSVLINRLHPDITSIISFGIENSRLNFPQVLFTTMVGIPVEAATTKAIVFNETLTQTFTETIPIVQSSTPTTGVMPAIVIAIVLISLGYVLFTSRSKLKRKENAEPKSY